MLGIFFVVGGFFGGLRRLLLMVPFRSSNNGSLPFYHNFLYHN